MKKKLFRFSYLLIVFYLLFCLLLGARKVTEKVNLEGFDRFVKGTMEEWRVPGLAIAINIGDGSIFS